MCMIQITRLNKCKLEAATINNNGRIRNKCEYFSLAVEAAKIHIKSHSIKTLSKITLHLMFPFPVIIPAVLALFGLEKKKIA